MDYSRYKTILAERRGRILTLSLNRPDALNAVNHVMHEELATIFADVQLDDACDVCVLTGAGRAFSAGGDIAEMQAAFERGGEVFVTLVDAKRIVFSLLDLEKPIIARVNGHAMGLGATIALFCDVVFMAKGARIGDPHVKAGVVAGDGGAVIWPQLVGYARAKEYLMTGDPLTAEEAERIGLVNHAVEPAELDARVYGYAEKLANGPTKAIKWTKVSANIGLKQLAHAIMDTSLAYEWITFKTEDHKEAARAFLERRQPKFTGR
jgi:enoyl-CoA hydratase